MTLDLNTLLRQAVETIRSPRDGVRWVRSIEMERTARWEALLLIVVVSVMLGQISTYILLGEINVVLGPVVTSPLVAGIMQMSILVIMVFAIYWVGHAMGGKGGFGDTILLIAWLQFIMVLVQLAQTISMLVIPPLAGMLGIVGLVLFFWLLTNFIAELHSFRSLGRVFMMVVLAMIGFAVGLSVILSIIGVSTPGAV